MVSVFVQLFSNACMVFGTALACRFQGVVLLPDAVAENHAPSAKQPELETLSAHTYM